MTRSSATFGLIGLSICAGLYISASIADAQAPSPIPSIWLQGTTPGTMQTGNANMSGTLRAGSLIGNGAGITNLNAANMSSGILAPARGGTGANTSGAPNGSMLFFLSSLGQWTVLGPGASGNVLKMGASLPDWSADGLDLPYNSSITTGFGMTLSSTSTSDLISLDITSASAAEAIDITHAGSGEAVRAVASGTGIAGYFENTNAASAANTLRSQNNGTGYALDILATGTGDAGRFRRTTTAGSAALIASSSTSVSSGVIRADALAGGSAGYFANSVNTNFTLYAVNNGGGPSAHLDGDVVVSGDLDVSGTKSFAIDHPFDSSKVLFHYCHEGPEPQNVYNGNVRTDAKGEAWVQLPDYFEAINRDFRYSLTVVDGTDSSEFVQVKIARVIENNRFKIKTSAPNTLVSWSVNAIRNDDYVKKNGAPVTAQKISDDPTMASYRKREK